MKWLHNLPLLLAGLVVVAGLAFVIANVAGAARLPEGPVPVIWDREACAHCRMHLGEPAFAVQLQTKDGRILFYDDPGCTFLHIAESPLEVHALYFRHLREDRWLPADRTAFARVEHSPMGFGIGAVDATEPGAISYAEGRAVALARRKQGTPK